MAQCIEDLCLFVTAMHMFDNVNTWLSSISDVNDIFANLPWHLCVSMEQPPECVNPVCREVVDHQHFSHGDDLLVGRQLFAALVCHRNPRNGKTATASLLISTVMSPVGHREGQLRWPTERSFAYRPSCPPETGQWCTLFDFVH